MEIGSFTTKEINKPRPTYTSILSAIFEILEDSITSIKLSSMIIRSEKSPIILGTNRYSSTKFDENP
tara:strand:+ start:674 stop:874 length:201 start_codon:yes stop_codon:yes gene_type:complete